MMFSLTSGKSGFRFIRRPTDIPCMEPGCQDTSSIPFGGQVHHQGRQTSLDGSKNYCKEHWYSWLDKQNSVPEQEPLRFLTMIYTDPQCMEAGCENISARPVKNEVLGEGQVVMLDDEKKYCKTHWYDWVDKRVAELASSSQVENPAVPTLVETV
eukprot:TRINITY_DN6823_c0_g1_i1.p1 TRINITY_DN6823_c0_g1~~TRINITY_DN6823_c0_g1_i1.p1  ORF type:complete len:155 (-),score=17.57 TRINITY_DN6823_c0_g1_i1:100-564(-)